MPNSVRFTRSSPVRSAISSGFAKSTLEVLSVLILAPLAAHAQGSPFDTGLNALQGLFSGTVAKVASLIAIVTEATDSRTASPAPKRRSLVLPPERALPLWH
jgi:hypothetical protein